MMMRNRQRGKATERALARRLKCRCVGLLGREDLEHPLFSIEVKSRMRFTGERFMQQAIQSCPEGKTPLVIVHLNGRHHGNDLVIMRLKDFEDYLGSLKKGGENHE